MVLWILFAVMTAAACLLLLRPFQTTSEKVPEALSATDIYKDQLGELERDLKEGLISADEMEAAQAEISRRILDLARKSKNGVSKKSSQSRHKNTVLAMLVIVPAVSLPVYLWVGQPNFKPVTQAQLKQQQKLPSMEVLLQKVEAHLKKNPDDINGWIVLARVYANMEQKEDVKRATDNIKRIREKADAIQNMSKEDRLAVIQSMVASLHEKLKADGRDVEGWERLIQSYMVLGQKEKAHASYTEAQQALSGNEEARKRLTNFMKRFSVAK